MAFARCWSPPVRGRGSKRQPPSTRRWQSSRPPCGGVDRNWWSDELMLQERWSPPVRGRGSKPLEQMPPAAAESRPPCGGVDRNLRYRNDRTRQQCRPPCGGVDRNHCATAARHFTYSRPPCGGVDRNHEAVHALMDPEVAPRAGAWIETPARSARHHPIGSPPVRGRGSKHVDLVDDVPIVRRPPCGGVDRNRGTASAAIGGGGSPPVRGRGSKLQAVWRLPRRQAVAPRAGAWIETCKRRLRYRSK